MWKRSPRWRLPRYLSPQVVSAVERARVHAVRLWPFIHAALALWGLEAFVHLYQRSRVVPVALVVGPWRETVYPPWLLLGAGLCGTVLLWRVVQGVGALRGLGRRDPRSTTPTRDDSEETTPAVTSPGWPDLVLGAAVGLVAWVLLDAFRRARNPLGTCVGMDAPTFLGDIVAIGLGRWDLYNTDKRLPYPWLSAKLADWSGLSYLEAGQVVSFASAVLLGVVVYLLARAFTGRRTAILAALLHLSLPILHPYAVQTTSYAFFYLVVNGTVAAAAWAVVTRRGWLYVLTGALAVLSVGTQIKGLTVVVPVLSVVVLWTVARGLRASLRPLVLLAAPIAVGMLLSERLPVRYTPLSWLIAHHREEVHQDIPYQWRETVSRPLDSPSVLSPWLPGFLRGGELEALAAVLLAPADADVVVFPRQASGGGRGAPHVLSGTTIPPLEVRVARNLEGLVQFLPENRIVLLMLLGLGILGALVPLPRGLPPCRRGAGWVLVAALVSVWGSLSLKFHIRYLLQALPAASILVVHGVDVVAWQWVGRAPRAVRGASAVLVACSCVR